MNNTSKKISQLAIAIAASDVATVQTLLGDGISAKEHDEWGRPMILLAAERGHVGILASLIDAGADVNAESVEPRNRTKGTPPTRPSQGAVVGQFRYEDDQSLGPPSRALEAAIRAGQLECVRLLVSKGARLYASIAWGDPPLTWAAAHPDPAFVRELAAAGAPIDDVSCDNPPLVQAILSGNEEVVRAMLDLGADPNLDLGGEDGWGSPLHAAACHNRLSIAKLLIERGANPRAKDSGRYTPFEEASSIGHVEMFEFLASFMPPAIVDRERETLERALPPDRRTLGSPNEKLLHAAAYLDRDLLLAALNEGADIQATDENGRTALHKTVYWGNVELTKLLLDAGADPNSRADIGESQGQTPLHDLANPQINAESTIDLKAKPSGLIGPKQVVAMLVAKGADLNARLLGGHTPLALAAIANNMRFMRILVDAGAGIDVPTVGGRSVKDLVAGFENFAGRRDQMLQILGGIGEKERAAMHQADMGRELRQAIMFRQLDEVNEILNSGFEIRSDAGAYALATAVNSSRDSSDIVAILLAAGADPNDDWVTAYHTLFDPFINGNLKPIRLLLDAGLRIPADTVKKLKAAVKRRLKKSPSESLEEAVIILQQLTEKAKKSGKGDQYI